MIKRLVSLLNSIEEWKQKRPTNPVQQFKPHNAFIPQSRLEPLQKELQLKEALLKEKNFQLKKAISPKTHQAVQQELQDAKRQLETAAAEYRALQKELQTAKAQVSSAPSDNALQELREQLRRKETVVTEARAQYKKMQETVAAKEKEIGKLHQQVKAGTGGAAPAPGLRRWLPAILAIIIVSVWAYYDFSPTPDISKDIPQQQNPVDSISSETNPGNSLQQQIAKKFRSTPINDYSTEAVKSMLQQNDFYCSGGWSWDNPDGRGFENQFEKQQSGKVVYDKASGLTWQQGGSNSRMTYKSAQEYIDDLNAKEFGGYGDWRLPTLEEAMSLMEPEKKNGDLYIDPVFDKT